MNVYDYITNNLDLRINTRNIYDYETPRNYQHLLSTLTSYANEFKLEVEDKSGNLVDCIVINNDKVDDTLKYKYPLVTDPIVKEAVYDDSFHIPIDNDYISQCIGSMKYQLYDYISTRRYTYSDDDRSIIEEGNDNNKVYNKTGICVLCREPDRKFNILDIFSKINPNELNSIFIVNIGQCPRIAFNNDQFTNQNNIFDIVKARKLIEKYIPLNTMYRSCIDLGHNLYIVVGG